MKQEGGKRAARKGAYILGSTAFQIVLVAGLIVASTAIRAATQADQLVDVKFIRAAPPPPPPPPPARKKSAPKPKSDAPKPPPASPTAMIQPKDVPEEMKPPDPSEKEEEPDYGDEGSDGVVGGVVGAGQFEEAPKYMQAGFRKPTLSNPRCIQENMRVPAALQGFISGPITLKIGIRRDGSVQALQIMTAVPDKRIEDAIRHAVGACPFIPGADAQGRPTPIWVIMPIRLIGG